MTLRITQEPWKRGTMLCLAGDVSDSEVEELDHEFPTRDSSLRSAVGRPLATLAYNR